MSKEGDKQTGLFSGLRSAFGRSRRSVSEEEIKAAYQLNYVHIIPRYPTELFTPSYIDEMLIELQRRGAVANGFFYDYDYSVDTDAHTIEIKIGFSNGGIQLLYNDDTPQIAEQIIRDEFGLEYTVSIVRDEGMADKLRDFQAERVKLLQRPSQRA